MVNFFFFSTYFGIMRLSWWYYAPVLTQFGEIEEALKDSITSMDEAVLNEAVLEAAAPVSKEDKKEAAVVRELKLESLKAQNEMIEDEREEMMEEEQGKEKKKAKN